MVETIDLYEAIQKMRKLTQKGQAFSFTHPTTPLLVMIVTERKVPGVLREKYVQIQVLKALITQGTFFVALPS